MKSIYFFLLILLSCSYSATNNNYIKLLLVISLFQSKQIQVKTYCKIDITSPMNTSTITNNGKSDITFFFTVSGVVNSIDSSLSSYNICLFQNKRNGTEWWRSGNSITELQVGKNGEWTTDAASCGPISGTEVLDNCSVTAIVQKNICPPDTKKYTGSEMLSGGVYCSSGNNTYNK